MLQNPEANIKNILITTEQLDTRISELAQDLTQDYSGKSPIAVSILKGAFVFMADLMRKLPFSVPIDFMATSSYGAGTTSTGKLDIRMDIRTDVAGKDIILVEDILDSGITLYNVRNMLISRGAASVKICTLLDKPARHKTDIVPDYVGFTIPDEFVVGFGLDFAEEYRNLPYVAVLKPEAYL